MSEKLDRSVIRAILQNKVQRLPLHYAGYLKHLTREDGFPLWLIWRERTCKLCGQQFLGRGHERSGLTPTSLYYCSDACAHNARNQRRRKTDMLARREAVETQPRHCAVCGERMPWRRGTRRYCSNACRQAAYRQA
jgi:predicted nucleic acid-binding Zn ribbon protein